MQLLGHDCSVLDPPAAVDLLSWRTAMTQAIVPLDIREFGAEPFQGRFRCTSVGPVGLFDLETSAHSVHRTPDLITKDQPRFYKLTLQLSGQCHLEQDGRTATLGPGDLAVYDTHRPYSLTLPEPGSAMVMIFPQEMVELTAAEVSHVTAVRFAGDQGFGRMINPFFTELSKNLDQLAGSYASRLVHSALDLIVTMLSHTLHSRQSRFSSTHHLVHQIRDYITQNLADSSLTPSSIAAAHFISRRYLYMLFSKESQTVSAWIRSQRLSRICRDLTDPLYADKPVSWIANRWGLHDAAHFSRLFKAHHGESPAAYRRRHLESAPGLARAA